MEIENKKQVSLAAIAKVTYPHDREQELIDKLRLAVRDKEWITKGWTAGRKTAGKEKRKGSIGWAGFKKYFKP
jgi:hypothetical protein